MISNRQVIQVETELRTAGRELDLKRTGNGGTRPKGGSKLARIVSAMVEQPERQRTRRRGGAVKAARVCGRGATREPKETSIDRIQAPEQIPSDPSAPKRPQTWDQQGMHTPNPHQLPGTHETHLDRRWSKSTSCKSFSLNLYTNLRFVTIGHAYQLGSWDLRA